MSFNTFSLSLILIATLSITLQYAKADQKLIDNVCSHVWNQTSCSTILKSTPGAANVDLKGLAQITIDLANSTALTTLRRLQSLDATTKDPNLKNIYHLCVQHYSSAVNFVDESGEDLKGGDLMSLHVHASAAVSEVDNCIDEGTIAQIDASVKAGNVKFDVIGSIILALTNLL